MLNDAWIDFIAGWCSGGAAVIACQPVDTVLTRMQAGATILQTATATTSGAATAAGSGGNLNIVLRPTNIAKDLLTQAGIRSLWRGSSAMIGAVPMQNALLMSGYGFGKRWCEDRNLTKNHVYLGCFVGGCTGGVFQSFLMSPVELIKVTQQVVGKNAAAATSSVARGLFTTSSSGAWKGLGATLLRDGIPHGVWFASYEYAKTELEERRHLGEASGSGNSGGSDNVMIPLVSGAFAAAVAWGVGYPFDLIKTRIQAGGTQGIVGTAKELVQEAGGRPIAGLYRGFGLKLLRAVPASAIGFTVYEFVKDQITG
eukprot:CAMPEP_0195281352 /NCGR_PEP_ID=MMETSP0707-20130614/701_1 /TAXON_ID=33640 /ORGANISM="Asterionellopsis glacialis, Strain CCMP134" /LENGTH=312 /DNA_ID=CAMNT_0040340233 /DNA_START=168 /DNA_END=1106 /DNA_ORIENTATION=+